MSRCHLRNHCPLPSLSTSFLSRSQLQNLDPQSLHNLDSHHHQPQSLNPHAGFSHHRLATSSHSPSSPIPSLGPRVTSFKKSSPFPSSRTPARGGRAPYRPSLKLFLDAPPLERSHIQHPAHPDWDRGAPDGEEDEEVEKEEEEREGGETMDDVIRTAKEVKTFEQILAFFLRRLMSISNQVRRLIRGSSVTSCASSELVPLQEDRSLTIYINVLGSSASCFHGSTCRVEAKVLGHFGPP